MLHRLAIALLLCTTTARVISQPCPQANPAGPPVASEVLTLEGQLVFHDGIRQWFELKLDRPQCEQSSTELVRGDKDWKPLEILRGCRVKSRGEMAISGTGYYSLETYQFVDEITPVGNCARQLPFPDYSKDEPAPAIRRYRVTMQLDYEPGDHPIIFHVSSGGKKLQPWQAYASYDLTGGFVLYGHCGRGFVVYKVFGPPQANPGHFDEPRTSSDMAMFDPETAASSGVKSLNLRYTCVRSR